MNSNFISFRALMVGSERSRSEKGLREGPIAVAGGLASSKLISRCPVNQVVGEIDGLSRVREVGSRARGEMKGAPHGKKPRKRSGIGGSANSVPPCPLSQRLKTVCTSLFSFTANWPDMDPSNLSYLSGYLTQCGIRTGSVVYLQGEECRKT